MAMPITHIIAALVLGWLAAARAAPAACPGCMDHMPSGCENSNYCALAKAPLHYPQDTINELLSKVTLARPRETSFKRSNIADFDEPCDKNNSVFYRVFAVRDKESRVRVVVQSDVFRQQVVTETCASQGPIEQKIGNAIPKAYLSHPFVCRELTLRVKLVVLSLDGRRLEPLQTSLPAGCVCRLDSSDRSPCPQGWGSKR